MAKLTLADIKRRGRRIDRTRVQATTAEEIDQHAREDGTESDLPGPAYPFPANGTPPVKADPDRHRCSGRSTGGNMEELGTRTG